VKEFHAEYVEDIETVYKGEGERVPLDDADEVGVRVSVFEPYTEDETVAV
jgi:hypothetical protein